jgi:hypothetical protein
MDGNVRAHFDQGAEALLALVTDPDYLRRRAEASGEKNIAVQVDRQGSRIQIRIARDIERNLPGFMKKLFSATSHLIDLQNWDISGPTKTSDWTVQIEGQKRVELRGRQSLAPSAGGGCDYIEAFTASVNIPLVGGRVEKYIVGETEAAIRQQIEFLRKNLAG